MAVSSDSVTAPLNLSEYETLARARMEHTAWGYYAGGADDEVTLGENPLAWQRLRLRPRVLVDVTNTDTSTTVLGTTVAMPVLTAPCALNRLAHPDGELAVARATAQAGVIQVLSTVSSTSLEDVAAAANGTRWFQLYCYTDREITADLVRRAEAAGYSAICLTVDLPVLGRREREIRAGFAAPDGITMKNLEPYAKDVMPEAGGTTALARYVSERWDARLTWDVIPWLKSVTRLPIVAKGILTHEDARLAVGHGVDAIIVSNHGGRQLDTVLTGAEALPEVVAAVAGRCEVLVDGGIRRGTDVVKAIALGARAVLIGRPYLWALAVDGEAGVARVLQLLRDETGLAMALAGRRSVSEIDASLIAR